jgi:hypothetical protein
MRHGRRPPLFVALMLGALASMAGGIQRAWADVVPSMNAPELAQGPYSAMHMLLQKTFLKFDVLTLEVRVDKPTQQKLAALARGMRYSNTLARQLGEAVMASEHALIQMNFMRDVSLQRWISEVKDNLEEARKADLISTTLEMRIGESLPEWFSDLKDRGYEDGDRLYYAVAPDSLHTVLTDSDGKTLIEHVDHEKEDRDAVLATYFAPGSDFREPLLRSLFEEGN